MKVAITLLVSSTFDRLNQAIRHLVEKQVLHDAFLTIIDFYTNKVLAAFSSTSIGSFN